MKNTGLALCGGGILGAFQAGFMYNLPEQTDFSCVSGASIGAVNACLLYSGNKETLKNFWFNIGDDMPDITPSLFNLNSMFISGAKNFTRPRSDFWNLFLDGLHITDCSPFIKFISKHVDFNKINSLNSPIIYISATDIQKGTDKLFTNKEINIDNLTASFSIPEIFPFKYIDDKAYWDGAFTRNPALLPMLDNDIDEIWIVKLIKQQGAIPKTKDELRLRMNEITFNNSLRLEIDFMRRLNNYCDKIPGMDKHYRKITIKTIELDMELEPYYPLYADKKLIKRLWDYGAKKAMDI